VYTSKTLLHLVKTRMFVNDLNEVVELIK